MYSSSSYSDSNDEFDVFGDSDDSDSSSTSSGESENNASSDSEKLGDNDIPVGPVISAELGSFLSTTPPVIERILCNLKAQDLNQSACVCKMWSIVAKAIKKKRVTPSTMFQVSINLNKRPRLHLLVDSHFNPYSDKQFVCKKMIDLHFRFRKEMRGLCIEPHLAIMFTCHFLIKYDDASLQQSMMEEMKWITKYLPRDSSLICLASQGIVGTPVSRLRPFEAEENGAISGIFFPQNVPGIKFHHFEISSRLKEKANLSMYNKRRHLMLNDDEISNITKIPQDVDVKCLLLFASEFPQGYGYTKSLTLPIVEHYLKKKIAFGGGVANAVNYKTLGMFRAKYCTYGTGLAISGEKVTAASIVLPEDVREKSEVLHKLTELKNKITLRSRSIGFLFACCGRGTAHYGASNVESNCFHQVFPKTKLIGMFGNGEYGVNFIPDDLASGEMEDKASSNINFMHTYSSVFVIVTWDET